MPQWLRRFCLAGLLVLLGGLVGAGGSPARADPAPLRIMPLGDSITAQCTLSPPSGYCAELGRLLTAAGVPYVFVTAGGGSTPSSAVSGTTCSYWAAHVHDVLVANNPDVVLVGCGTNDDQSTPAATTAFAAAYRTLLETIRSYRPADPIRIGVALIGYSNVEINESPAVNRAWLIRNEPITDDTIYSQVTTYYKTPWGIPFADMQPIPGDWLDLLGGTDGIHPTPVGYLRMGRIWFDAGASVGWWPATSEPPLCGMSGHRPHSATYLALVNPLPCTVGPS